MAKVKAVKEGLDVLGGLVKNAEEIAKKLVASGVPEQKALDQGIKLASQVEKAEAPMVVTKSRTKNEDEVRTIHPRGKPLGSQAIRGMAERIAPQTQGQFVRKSTNPKETRSVEDKSLKQFKAEQSMPMVVENNTKIKPPAEFNPEGYEGSVIVGVPGDPTYGGVLSAKGNSATRGTRQLRQVGDVVLDLPVQLYGGPEYGLGRNKPFWASNLTAARGIQNLVNDLGQEYPILGQYIKMGPGSENFAQHSLDALLSVMQPHNLSRESKDALTEIIKKGYPKGDKGQVTFESFSGFDDPKQVMLESLMDSELRKWIGKTLKSPNKMQPFGMPEGRYVATAITNPELRNLETGVSGFAVGEMQPGAELTRSSHPSYSHDIPGALIGRTRHPIPMELAFPDTYQRAAEELVNKPKGTDLYGLFKMSGPRQVIDDQYVDEINEYLRYMKALTGKKKGGEVHAAKGGLLTKGVKAAEEAIENYVDPIVKRIGDWLWRPMTDVRANVKATEVPEYVQKNYGEFMADQSKRAAAGDLNARDLIKAYGITRSSVNRGGLSHSTATKTGMKLPKTTELVRPEGAFAEWLGSKAGQKFLDDAQAGKINESSLSDLQDRFSPFGMPAVLAEDLRWATRNLPQKGATISADVLADPEVYREVSQQMRGIGPAKSGFMASMIGRGDFPTFDARQIRLHTGEGGSAASKYMRRGEGEGGEEAVARLAARQLALEMGIDPSLDPFYQHLVHHTIWDEIGDKGKPSQTTHEDIVKAMRGYNTGGLATSSKDRK